MHKSQVLVFITFFKVISLRLQHRGFKSFQVSTDTEKALFSKKYFAILWFECQIDSKQLQLLHSLGCKFRGLMTKEEYAEKGYHS